MACKSCSDPIIPDPNPHRNSCGVPSPVVVVNSGTQVIQFASVFIPSSQGDETSIPPTNGRYRNAVVSYEASGNVYLYTSDGIAVKLTPDQITSFDLLSGRPQYAGKEMTSATNIPDVDEVKAGLEGLVQDTATELTNAISNEANARSEGDSDLSNDIKAEAEERETAISELEEKIASQGTDVSELNAKLDGKQDKLTAGYGISIAEDTDTISVSLDQKQYVFANPLPEQPPEENKNKIFFTEVSEGSSEYNAYLWSTELNKWLGVTTFHADVDLAGYATTAYVDQEVEKSTSEITDFSASLTQLVNNETTAREQGDSALQDQIDGFQTSLDAETNAREEADANLQSAVSDLTSDLTAETTARENAVTALQNSVSTLQTGLSTETSERTAADNNLQGQIDALTSASDVVDVVGTKAALDSYDTSGLTDKDIIKVLNDESDNNQTTYYRWDTETSQFDLIGAQGPYYTVSAADEAIQTAVSAEASARQSADNTLTASVQGVQDSLASEVTARQNADSELDARITSISGGKQDALTAEQVAAVNSGITASKVATYDGYGDSIAGNTSNITSLSGRVTAVESTTSTLDNSVTTLNNSVSNLQTSKQDNLSATQLSAVNSGITSDKVSTYDGYATGKANVADTLAGYGITDAYTKSDVDSKLATKANTANTISGYGIVDAYTKEEVNTKLSGKANNATTLAGYGITDAYTKTEVDEKVSDTGGAYVVPITNYLFNASAVASLTLDYDALREAVLAHRPIVFAYDGVGTHFYYQAVQAEAWNLMVDMIMIESTYVWTGTIEPSLDPVTPTLLPQDPTMYHVVVAANGKVTVTKYTLAQKEG